MRVILLVATAALIASGVVVDAQVTCPAVDRVVPPVDMSLFSNVQDYGVRSPRHDGRYHTGEDWALTEANAVGQPVRAMANGIVTYAYDQGWGRDGGVVILEHTMPDDSTIYSVYGHLMQTQSAPFPMGVACVSAGDVIGAIADARPAPHLHFEIRARNGRSPGQGYTWAYPDESGHRHPSRFLQNWTARLDRSVGWVANLRPTNGYHTPPVILSDNSLLIANGSQVVRLLPDGRQLWREQLDVPIASIIGFQGASYVYTTDGRIQQMDAEGELIDSIRTDVAITGSPFVLDDLLVFSAGGNGLVAYDRRLRAVQWQTSGLPIFREAWVGSQVIGFRTHSGTLMTTSRSGETVLDEARLGTGSVMVNADGALLVYSSGGLWQITADGNWQLAPYNVPLPTEHGAIAAASEGDWLLYDGVNIRRYGGNGVEQWAYPMPATNGAAALAEVDGRALLYTANGDIAVVSPLGRRCYIKVWAGHDAYLWHNLGDDGTLRVMIGSTVTGLNWQRFSRDCDL
jgi:hypothetical protein